MNVILKSSNFMHLQRFWASLKSTLICDLKIILQFLQNKMLLYPTLIDIRQFTRSLARTTTFHRFDDFLLFSKSLFILYTLSFFVFVIFVTYIILFSRFTDEFSGRNDWQISDRVNIWNVFVSGFARLDSNSPNQFATVFNRPLWEIPR